MSQGELRFKEPRILRPRKKRPAPQQQKNTDIAIIGAGAGGLCAALRLQAMGFSVTLIEARSECGGQMRAITRDGFTMETGHAYIHDLGAWQQLWALTGGNIAKDVEFIPLSSAFRAQWLDTASFEFGTSPADLAAEIVRMSPTTSSAAIERFYDMCRDYSGSGQASTLMHRAGELIGKYARQNAQDALAPIFEDARIKEILCLFALTCGANPYGFSGARAMAEAIANTGTPHGVRGGYSRLIAALARRFELLGGQVFLGDAVRRIHVENGRVVSLETQSGGRISCRAAVISADPITAYATLFDKHLHAHHKVRSLRKRAYGPSLFAVHFGIEGRWPGIAHRTVLMPENLVSYGKTLFETGVIPRDFPIILDHPSLSDATLAPNGKSLFRAQVFVPNLTQNTIDWQGAGPLLQERVLSEVERRIIPDLRARIVTQFVQTPRDLKADFGLYGGSVFGAMPSIRAHITSAHAPRDKHITNLYLSHDMQGLGLGLDRAAKDAQRASAAIAKDIRL